MPDERSSCGLPSRAWEDLHCVVQDLPYACGELDREWRIVALNRCACEMIGYTPAEASGLRIDQVIHPRDVDRVHRDLQLAMEEPSGALREYAILRKDGREVVVEGKAVPLTRDGSKVGLVVICNDATTRHLVQRKLRESEALHRTLLEALPEAVVQTDLTGRITYASPKAVEVSGSLRPDELLGRSAFDLIVPEHRELASYNLQRTLTEGVLSRAEYALMRVDGTCYPGELSAALLRDAAGYPKGFVGVIRNMSDCKNAEESLQRAEDQRCRLVRELCDLRQQEHGRFELGSIIGSDPKMHALCECILAASPTKVAIVIRGETGTGKELVARTIHHCSRRSQRPFVKVDCGALPEGPLEGELFGRDKCTVADPVKSQRGHLKLADGGTVFLDKVDSTSPALQAKLLRVMEEGRFERIDSNDTIEIDVRVIAATNEDLGELVGQRAFRRDLYYRLNVVSLVLPPLRERRGDIPLLARAFIQRFACLHDRPVMDLSPGALTRLQQYDWPGNVRELEHVIEEAVISCRGKAIERTDLRLPRPEGRRRSTT